MARETRLPLGLEVVAVAPNEVEVAVSERSTPCLEHVSHSATEFVGFVRGIDGLGYEAIDDAQLEKVSRRYTLSLGNLWSATGVPVQERRRTFRRQRRQPRVFSGNDSISWQQGERTAARAFADHQAHRRSLEADEV